MGHLKPPGRVDAAMRAMPREHFLPEVQRGSAHVDRPLPIGNGQTSSQPSTVRQMLELLDVLPGHRVLDVGSGSGWTTAILAVLVGSSGSVLGVELVPELAAWGAANVADRELPWASVTPAVADRLGCLERSPYDRVLVSAGARTLPEPLVQQLGPDGVMVAPVAGRMLRIRRRADGGTEVERLGRYRFVPLR